MPLQITARHTELPHDLRALIETKAERFRKMAVADQLSVLDVIVAQQKGKFTVEVNVKAHRMEATGSVTNGDLRSAIDAVMDKVERQLRKQLDKRVDRKRHTREARARRSITLTVPFLNGLMPAVEPEIEDKVIFHTSRILTKPMSVEEAAEQLEIESGAFLVFNNAETDKINIICRRDDGNFSVIEPS
jgi:putative sigma-54 modulation protein